MDQQAKYVSTESPTRHNTVDTVSINMHKPKSMNTPQVSMNLLPKALLVNLRPNLESRL